MCSDCLLYTSEVGGEAYSYASDYEIVGKLKQFADKHCICVLTVHHTRKQPAGDAFEMISGTTGLLGCADGSLLMQKKKRTALEATIDVVGRDQQDQILYLKKDPETQIWNLERMEMEPHKEPPDPVLEAVARMVNALHIPNLGFRVLFQVENLVLLVAAHHINGGLSLIHI